MPLWGATGESKGKKPYEDRAPVAFSEIDDVDRSPTMTEVFETPSLLLISLYGLTYTSASYLSQSPWGKAGFGLLF